MPLRFENVPTQHIPAAEECDSCNVMLKRLKKAAKHTDMKEFVAEKGSLKFKTSFETDKMFLCQADDDKCLIVDSTPAAFQEVKSLFASLGFAVR